MRNEGTGPQPLLSDESKENPEPSLLQINTNLSGYQHTAALTIALVAAGYSGFADSMECLYTMLPIRYEYAFDQDLAANKWLLISAITAGIYGLSTVLSEGKGVYDTASDYFISRNRINGQLAAEEEAAPLARIAAVPTAPYTLSQKVVSTLAWSVSFISSAADSTETTMGLVKEGSSLTKTIAISAVSFLGSISFYGPLTAEAMDDLRLGSSAHKPEDNRPSQWLAKIVGYPVALFSAIQDTLECGASLFQNFGIDGIGARWGIVGASSLAGLSGLCLDGKKGVEIIDNFLTHLQTDYAWMQQTALCQALPSKQQLYQLFYESATCGVAAYAASFIAFADKELTISLTEDILAILGAEIAGLPHILGWCVVLRDFVIQTSTLNALEHVILDTAYHSVEKLKQRCLQAPAATPAVDLELAERRNAVESEGDEEVDEETSFLLPQHRSIREEKISYFGGFFKAKANKPKEDYLAPASSKWTCLVM